MKQNGIDPDLANFAGFVRNDMTGLDKMNLGGFGPQNKITMPPKALVQDQGLSPFIERPSANYAGSESAVGFNASAPDFMPIPDDMRERVLAMAREENPVAQRTPPPKNPQTPVRPEETAVLNIPNGYDFDLFQFAVLKDLSCNIEKVLVQLDECKKNLEKNKTTIDFALAKSPISKK